MRRAVWTAVALALVAQAGSVALAAQTPEASPAAREGLSPGDEAPVFAVETLTGARTPIEYARGAPTVLLFFLASCPHCKKLIPQWNAAHEARGAGVKVLGVMLDREPPGWFELVPISFPVVHVEDPRGVSRLFRLTRVPMTVRVGPDRRVADVVVGDVEPARLSQLFGK